jgi:diadenosine tetraphosphate (Ap4A) HIT family hydrolase
MYLTFFDDYDATWADLNSHLKLCEQSEGTLTSALLELEAHQKRAGFIQDALNDVERYNYVHPEFPFRYFQVQYNPRRALRFKGSGINLPPEEITSVNNGCFLCRENIQWQQQGKEMGYEIEVRGTDYYAFMNPFPLLPCHVVITTRDHVSQEWELHPEGKLSLESLVGNLVELALRMPGFIGFYNGINAGASIPGHMHYQFCMRPDEMTHFPLEQAERDFTHYDHTGIAKHYPLAVAIWQGTAEQVVNECIDWVRHWAEHNAAHLDQLTSNLIVTTDPQSLELSLYFAPRHRDRAKSAHMSGLIGGLEVLGELVLSTEEERFAIEHGKLNYPEIVRIYDDVYTPFFIDTPTRLESKM